MADSVEKTGKTVDAAVFSALEELGATIDEVIVEVLEEGEGGILGIGRRPARVRVTLDRLDEQLSRGGGESERQYAYAQEQMNARDFNDSDLPNRGRLADEASDTDNYEDGDSYQDALDDEACRRTVQFVETILEGMDVSARVRTKLRGDTLYLDVDGDDVGAVIGRRGETLSAMQYLSSLVLNKDNEDRRHLVLDVAGYRRRREKALEDLARRTAGKVIKVGKEYVMEEMPAFERRVIHATLQEYPGVKTVSEGDEPHRYVVVVPLRKGGRRKSLPLREDAESESGDSTATTDLSGTVES